MNNERSLFPPLFRKVDSGGGSEIREKIAEIDSEITRISDDITQIDSTITRLSETVEGVKLVKKSYPINLTDSNNWYVLDASYNTDNVNYIIGSLVVTASLEGGGTNIVKYPNGYSDSQSNVQIYVADDSGLSFYGRSTAVNSTFAIEVYINESEVI